MHTERKRPPQSASSSPAPLSDEHVDKYRTMMTPTPGGDWDGIAARVAAARWFGERSYDGGDRAAWETSQLAQIRLTKRGNRRPTDPADVHVLDTLYGYERACLGQPDYAGAKPEAFSRELFEYLSNTELDFSMWTERSGGPDEIEYYAWVVAMGQWNFTYYLAAVSLRVPFSSARLLYKNLGDEAAETAEESHPSLADRLFEFAGIHRDPEQLLAHASPEFVAFQNSRWRSAWHPSPGHGVGALLVDELYLSRMVPTVWEHLSRLGVPADVGQFFTEHADIDPHHARDLLAVVQSIATTPEEQRDVLAGALEHGFWWQEQLRCEFHAIERYKQDRQWSRTPVEELPDV